MPRLSSIMFVVIIAAVLLVTEAKIYQPCSLAEELIKLGFPSDKQTLGNWVCLAKFGSGFNTKTVNGPNPDGSFKYGIFQITDKSWCTVNKNSFCGVNCKDLLSDDITKSAACAMKVFKTKGGFTAWDVWVDDCKGKDVTRYVNKCELRRSRSAQIEDLIEEDTEGGRSF